MPNTRASRTPSYRCHKPSGQAVVTLDGRDLYLGSHGTKASRNRYDQLIAEWLANGRCLSPASGGPSDLSVVELISAYLEHALTYYSRDGRPTIEHGSITVALRPLRRLYGRTRAAEFGPLKLKTVREAMIRSGWSRRHVNTQVGRVKRVFKWAVESELVSPSVYHGLQALAGLRKGRSPAPETEPVRPAPDELVDAVQPHISHRRSGP